MTYSGGTGTSIHEDGDPWIQAYDIANGFDGSYDLGSWGIKMLPDGTEAASSGSARSEGTITTTFTWQSYGMGGQDDPPTDVVIAEQCAAT